MLEEKILEYKRAHAIRVMLEERQEEMTYLADYSPESHTGGSGISDPTAVLAMKRKGITDRIAAALETEDQAKEVMETALTRINDDTIRRMALYHFYEGHSWSKTAVKLGMKTSAVKMRWKRFREKEAMTTLQMAEVIA